MIYTVTFNPSIDYIVSVNQLEVGKVNRTSAETILPGGKGVNVSQVLGNLDVDNVALGFIAGFTGEQLVQMLHSRGIKTDFISVTEGITRINVKLRYGITEETEINGQGPHIAENELILLLNKISTLDKDDILVVSGSVPQDVSQSIYADILKICNTKGIKAIVDASGALLWNVLEYAPFLIKPNHHELGDIFNREINNREEIIFYAKELQKQGARNVLVSRGEKGAILVAEDGNVYVCDAPQGKVVNTVGAGDSMVAGFLAGYLESNANYEAALKMGVCAGSASAFSEKLATKEGVLELCR